MMQMFSANDFVRVLKELGSRGKYISMTGGGNQKEWICVWIPENGETIRASDPDMIIAMRKVYEEAIKRL